MKIRPPSQPNKEGNARKRNPRSKRNKNWNPNNDFQLERNYQYYGNHENEANVIKFDLEDNNLNSNIQKFNFKTTPKPNYKPVRASKYYQELLGFIDREMEIARNDSDRVFVYKQAFETLLLEFQACKPVLERIKNNYDTMSSSLIQQKHNIRVNDVPDNLNEDTYTEVVHSLKRSKVKEFKSRQEETEKLLDEMTQLRLEKLQLSNDLKSIIEQKDEITMVEENQENLIYEYNTRIHNALDEIKTKDAQTTIMLRKIDKLEDKLSKAKISNQELEDRNNILKGKLDDLKSNENELQDKLSQLLDDNKNSDANIENLEKEIWELRKRLNNITQRCNGIKERKNHSDRIMREMLKKHYNNSNESLINIIHHIADSYYY